MWPGRRRAAQIGIEAVDPVDQTFAAEKLQRPIDRGRRHAPAVLGQLIEDLIGADRRMAAPDQLEYPASQLGQARTAAGAQIVRLADRGMNATAMVVWLGDEGIGGPDGRHRRGLAVEGPAVERRQEIARASWPGQ